MIRPDIFGILSNTLYTLYLYIMFSYIICMETLSIGICVYSSLCKLHSVLQQHFNWPVLMDYLEAFKDQF